MTVLKSIILSTQSFGDTFTDLCVGLIQIKCLGVKKETKLGCIFFFHSHIVATSDTTNTNLRRRVTRVHEKKGDSTIEDVKGLKDTQLDTKVMEHGKAMSMTYYAWLTWKLYRGKQ